MRTGKRELLDYLQDILDAIESAVLPAGGVHGLGRPRRRVQADPAKDGGREHLRCEAAAGGAALVRLASGPGAGDGRAGAGVRRLRRPLGLRRGGEEVLPRRAGGGAA